MMNILSVAEYGYRLGVKHGAYTKDPVAIKECTEETFKKEFRLLMDAPDHPLNVNAYCDRVIVWCGLISASALRLYLRASSELSLKTNILIMTQFYYKKGLIDGINVDKLTADNFLKKVAFGRQHINIVTGKKQSLQLFFDEFKYNTNILDEQWRENGSPSSLNRLSVFMGRAWRGRK